MYRMCWTFPQLVIRSLTLVLQGPLGKVCASIRTSAVCCQCLACKLACMRTMFSAHICWVLDAPPWHLHLFSSLHSWKIIEWNVDHGNVNHFWVTIYSWGPFRPVVNACTFTPKKFAFCPFIKLAGKLIRPAMVLLIIHISPSLWIC